jgi:ABC-type Na+ transport system ATPase subunit NatA
MLLGLIEPTSGAARVLGEEPGSPASLEGVGALVESLAFYPYLPGYDNLRVVSSYAGVPRRRIREVLETVELSGRAKDKFKKYSLGMKQRLGVAAALLKDPELLVENAIAALPIESDAFEDFRRGRSGRTPPPSRRTSGRRSRSWNPGGRR